MSRDKEKELLHNMAERSSHTDMQMVRELLTLRLDRYKESLVLEGDDVKRGRAQELSDLIKHLDKQV